MTAWMIYGANGFTGRLMAQEAVRRSMSPILGGRRREAVEDLAEELGLESHVFGLEDTDSVHAALSGCRLVLHCAGPFSATSQPMIEGCIASGAHYLDITGEIDVFANAHRQAERALHANVVLIPGVGFDVVASDCLAASLVNALPTATQLALAFEVGGGPSPGTAKTGVEGLGRGGRIRKDGELIRVPLSYKSRNIPFAHAERTAVTIPWGDVYTAFVSTGVPDIEVYLSVPPERIAQLRRLRLIQPLLGLRLVQSFIKRGIEKSVSGPDDRIRRETRSELWGEAKNAEGRSVSATMTTPNGYDLTVTAGLGIVEHLLNNDVEGGYYTPSLLMGAEYASTLPGVEMRIGER